MDSDSKEKISYCVYAGSPEIQELVELSARKAETKDKVYQPIIFSEISSAVDFLNYGQSTYRLFIAEFDENNDRIQKAIEDIHNDPWLHGTIIILIIRKLTKKQFDYLINHSVTDFISINELRHKLPVVLNIISSNIDLFESQQFISQFSTNKKGKIFIKNDLEIVPRACSIVLNFCYAAGIRNLELYSKISMCLYEMIGNAIEHGNCGIDYDTKTSLIEKNISLADAVKEIASRDEIKNRKVQVNYDISETNVTIVVKDDGDGFNIKDIPDPNKEENIFASHGRGILLTDSYTDKMKYNETGNEVTISFENKSNLLVKRQNELQQLTNEPILTLKAGEILFDDRSESDYFYYIIHGKLGIYVNARQVATSTPDDIFVGEMAFLHHNKRTGMVKALSDSKLLPISRNGFINMIKKYPYAGVFLARILTKRLVEKNREMS